MEKIEPILIGKKGKEPWYPKYAPHINIKTGKSILDECDMQRHIKYTKDSISSNI